MVSSSLLLYIAIGLLMVDSIIELSFISSMVGWLHRRAGNQFEIEYGGVTFPLSGRPLHPLVDQGHTSNGAAGTAFILIGLGGILALSLLHSRRWSHSLCTRIIYHAWLVLTVLSALLTLSALIFTFVITNKHKGQIVDGSLALQVQGKPYPADQWTPENWFSAVLQLNLIYPTDRSDITNRLRVMRGWRWNLIPMFILGLAVAVLAFVDALKRRSAMRAAQMAREEKYATAHEDGSASL